ncbi:MAG: phosphoadenylyl-sulfate reductase [Balneolaceae bacterium]
MRKEHTDTETLPHIRQQIDVLNDRFEGHHADDLLRWAWDTFAEKAVLGTGFGPSGLFLIHRLVEMDLPLPIFYLDTQLLFEQTYRLRDELEEKLGITIHQILPEHSVKEQAVQEGDELWNRDPDRCCYLRKVKPLQGYLADKQAWITGIRRHQADTRATTPVIGWEANHEVIKLNPVAAYSGEEIWDYIHDLDLPYNPMHDEGYPSIGCIPCTSPVEDGEDERDGRWRGDEKVECGIHFSPETGTFERTGHSTTDREDE